MADLDKDIAATMTPEELEAINAEASPEEQLIMRQQAAAEDDDENDAEGEGGDDNENDVDGEGSEAKAAPSNEQAAEPAAEEDAANEDDDEFKPKFEAQLPEDFDAQVAAVNSEFEGLAKRFKDGDIDFDEYNAEVAKLNARRDDLTAIKTKADVFETMNTQTAEQQWNFEVRRFMRSTAKAEGIDYTKDKDKADDLDLFVKRLANDEKNADKSYEWFLSEAHKRVKALHGITDQQADKPAGKKDPIAEARNARKADPGKAPKTLAQVPGGDGPGDVGGDEFAHIDNLDGLELETALAKMTPEQRIRYAQAA